MTKSIPNSSTAREPASLAGFEVLVGVCGGIAAYKTAEIVSRLVQQGAGVTVAMTRSARRFVTPLTFQALSGRPVLTSLWRHGEPADVQHIKVTEEAHLFVLAPATANFLAKAAIGLADDLLSTLVVSAASPILLAPAMNNRMWENPMTRRNVQTLLESGYRMIGPVEGWLACRNVGLGRMADPEQIVDEVVRMLKNPSH